MGFPDDDAPDPFAKRDPFAEPDPVPASDPVENVGTPAQVPTSAPEAQPAAPLAPSQPEDPPPPQDTPPDDLPVEPAPEALREAFREEGPPSPPSPAPGADKLARVPPHDEEAEVCVLGSLLLEPDCAFEVFRAVEEGDFYRQSHRRIYAAMLSLHEAGTPIDAVLLREELRRRGDLEAVGGPEVLVNLLDKVPTAAHALQYAEVVRRKALRRAQIEEGDRLIRAAFDEADDTDPVEVLSEASKRLLEVAHGASDENIECIGGGDLLEMKIDRPRLLIGEDDLHKSRILAEGQLLVVCGPPKLGKSLVVCEAALQLARKDGWWLGHRCHGPVRTVIIEAEGGLDLVQDWLTLMGKEYTKEEKNNIRIPVKLPRIDLTKPRSIRFLQRIIEGEEAKHLWLDPFFRLHLADENKNDEMRDVMLALAELRKVTKVGQSLVHHTSRGIVENTKGRATVRLRGATVVDAELDSLMTLDYPEEDAVESGATYFLFWDIRRGPKPPNQIVYRDAASLHHRVSELGATGERNGRRGGRERIPVSRESAMACLVGAERSAQQVAAMLGCSKDRAEKLLLEMGFSVKTRVADNGEVLYMLPEKEPPKGHADRDLFGKKDGP